jgi:hypothetical protein
MINQGSWCLDRRRLFTALVGLGAGAVIGCTEVMAAVEQKLRGGERPAMYGRNLQRVFRKSA